MNTRIYKMFKGRPPMPPPTRVEKPREEPIVYKDHSTCDLCMVSIGTKGTLGNISCCPKCKWKLRVIETRLQAGENIVSILDHYDRLRNLSEIWEELYDASIVLMERFRDIKKG